MIKNDGGSGLSGQFGSQLQQAGVVGAVFILARAAAAVTIENFACQEWVDDLEKGYHYTGENEVTGIWASLTPMTTIAIDAVRERLVALLEHHDVRRLVGIVHRSPLHGRLPVLRCRQASTRPGREPDGRGPAVTGG